MLRVLYHIGKDTKYIANKQECNRFFAPLPRGGGHSRREEEQGDRKRYIYNKVWANRENTQAGTKTSHITYIDNTITLYIN